MGNAFEKDKSLSTIIYLGGTRNPKGCKIILKTLSYVMKYTFKRVRESMEAKVEVIYGAAVKERMLQK
jgi:hypothetical protein